MVHFAMIRFDGASGACQTAISAAMSTLIWKRLNYGGDFGCDFPDTMRCEIASDFLAISNRRDCDFAIWASKVV